MMYLGAELRCLVTLPVGAGRYGLDDALGADVVDHLTERIGLVQRYRRFRRLAWRPGHQRSLLVPPAEHAGNAGVRHTLVDVAVVLRALNGRQRADERGVSLNQSVLDGNLVRYPHLIPRGYGGYSSGRQCIPWFLSLLNRAKRRKNHQ